MTSRLSSNHLLISALAKRKASKNPLQAGFTLVELLIVVIIIGILAAVALPGFLNQAEKAKNSSAKAIAASFAKECQLWLIDQDPATFAAKTVGNPNVVLSDTSCTSAGGGVTATVQPSGLTAIITIASDGGLTKSGTVGTW